MSTVSFVLNLDDYNALTRSIEKKRNGRADFMVRWLFPVLAALLGFTPLWAQWRTSGLIPAGGQWLSTYGNAAFWAFIGFWSQIYRISGRRKFRRGAHFGSEAHLELQEAGIRVRGPSGEALLPWQSIARVEEVPAHVFLYLNEKQAIIVPRRAFAGPDAARDFAREAQHFWQAAHPAPAPPPIAAPE